MSGSVVENEGAGFTRRALMVGGAAATMAAGSEALAIPRRSACAPSGALRLGALAAFPVGAWRAAQGVPVIVGRDARGLFAFSAECSHQGCALSAPSASAEEITCPCHGARFDGEGRVTAAPARSALENYQVMICEGVVYVQTDALVPVGTRTPV